MRIATLAVLGPALVAWTACGAADRSGAGAWAGTIDTLASGQVVVRNPEAPIWPAGEEWRVEEELRIGRVDGDGADVFGRILSLEVDDAGRMWVFDSQVQELRVFGPSGEYIRTVGRRGGGPGEFAQAVHTDLGPDGNIWVMDPQNNRLSVFDTAGTFLHSHYALGGFIVFPWPGRFDAGGNYYAPVPHSDDDGFGIAVVRYDTTLTPVDTLALPRDPVERERFEARSGNSRMMAGVPFQGGLLTRLSAAGTIWALLTDEYRLFELGPAGDTLRTITRPFTALPVTAADRDQAREDLEWFTDQGGKIDLSKLPDTKPPVSSFFLDDAGHFWVARVTDPESAGRVHDVFDPEGRFLGTVTLPFALNSLPFPIVRGGLLYGVTQDELEVQYVVRARIVRGPS